ncbi:hypothetical protein DN554_00985 [Burkholderia multivorans]|nr:hypothetical protein A8D61_33130 [Burkholderia cenocepacia]RAA47999.1 hypothetical protein DN500_07205 [Burkholderia multivorans]ONO22278.1 hypothetical protein A8D65_29450 [Burkholderia cenocepacia]ONO92902.1 hypothetical protein A8D79_19765 [Burkholderia cenocepacia]ONU25686.1 hypothetical protein A8E54_38965 [Burkholderia cenocepacia]
MRWDDSASTFAELIPENYIEAYKTYLLNQPKAAFWIDAKKVHGSMLNLLKYKVSEDERFLFELAFLAG